MYKMMVIDDEPLTREFLKNNIPLLDGRWEVVMEAMDGQEALEKLEDSMLDLIITDIKMPVMNGIELCKHIREKGSKIKIIILSGFEEFEFAKKAIQYGVHEYLLKPIVKDDLMSSINKITNEIEFEKKQKNVIATVKNFKESSSNCNMDNLKNSEFIKILEELIDVFGEKKTHESINESEIVIKVKNYIYFHYSEPLSLAEISQKMNLSSSYLSNIFHKGVGEPYIKFLTRIRMEEACKLLQITPQIRVYDVALRVGYISDKHFISTFKNYYKMTPGEYQVFSR